MPPETGQYIRWLADALATYHGRTAPDAVVHNFKVLVGAKTQSFCSNTAPLPLDAVETIENKSGLPRCSTCFKEARATPSPPASANSKPVERLPNPSKALSKAAITSANFVLDISWRGSGNNYHVQSQPYTGDFLAAATPAIADLVERSRSQDLLPLSLMLARFDYVAFMQTESTDPAGLAVKQALRGGDLNILRDATGANNLHQKARKALAPPQPQSPPAAKAPATPVKRALALLKAHQLDFGLYARTEHLATLMLDVGMPPNIATAFVLAALPDTKYDEALREAPELADTAHELRAQRLRLPGYKTTPLTLLVGRMRAVEMTQYNLRKKRRINLENLDSFLLDPDGGWDLPPELQVVHANTVRIYGAMRPQLETYVGSEAAEPAPWEKWRPT